MKIYPTREWCERSAEIEGNSSVGAGCQQEPCSLLMVIERPLLTNGGLSSAPNGVPVILIASDQAHREKLVTLWHEIVHLMRMAGGYSQDEASVEAAAQRLAAACPEALEWVGIHEANAIGMAAGAAVPPLKCD
jgi:hypothetical protein